MYKITIFFLLAFNIFASEPIQSAKPRIIKDLDVNQSHIAFTYAGQIWSVDRKGGVAKRLTDGNGESRYPRFSPNGRELAFSNNYAGYNDVYVMPSFGGVSKQLTYLGENDDVEGWTPDGKSVLFVSHRDEELVFRLHTIDKNGVLPKALPFYVSNAGSFSADGKRIAYMPKASFEGWRHYRGGAKGHIRIANLKTGEYTDLPRGEYNDKFPMWIGDKIFFTSDRSGHSNLYSYNLETKRTRQLTKFDKYGITAASAGNDVIVLVRGGIIYLYDLTNSKLSEIPVLVSIEKPELAVKEVSARRTLDSIMPSGKGSQTVINARGDILLFDAKTGQSQNLTNSSRIAERSPVMSPNKRSIAFFSDASGEYQLHIRSLETNQEKKFSIEETPTFYRELTWSPDSNKLTFTGKKLGLWIADVKEGKIQKIDRSLYSYQEKWFPNWSADSRWITYSKQLKNRVRTIFIHDSSNGKTHQITDGITHTESPVFDRNGKYLYFTWSPNAGTSEYGWGVLNGMMARPMVQRTLGLFILRDGLPSPFLTSGQPNTEAKPKKVDQNVQIDFDGIMERSVNIPQRPKDYARLAAGKPGQVYALVSEWGKSPGFLSNPTQSLYSYDVSKKPRFAPIAENIQDFDLSYDGSELIYSNRRGIFLVDPKIENKKDAGKLDLDSAKVKVNPGEEWQQIYSESWRIMRDWFYDKNHHGQDLNALEKHFANYLPSITRRRDLNDLLKEMLGHISVSHLSVRGGDQTLSRKASRIGALGADYEVHQGRFRFKKIYRTSHFNDPSGVVNAPLDQPGMRVRAGEYLIAVNGKKVDASKNVYSYFVGTARKPTKITVGPNSNGTNSRTINLRTASGENGLRRANWAEKNRKYVEEKSGGKLGYIYVGSYGRGILDFIRGISGYSDREGIIIDQRFNGGGITSDYLIEWLKRNPLYYYSFREGDDIATPVNPGPKTKVLITNTLNFSAAETFAFMYKLGKVGPVVGERTYGAGIGGYVFTPRLIDGGRIQIPNRAAYNPNGKDWGIENLGVAPDYEVENTQKDWLRGRDAQLEKAIEVALSEARKTTNPKKIKPKYPVHP